MGNLFLWMTYTTKYPFVYFDTFHCCRAADHISSELFNLACILGYQHIVSKEHEIKLLVQIKSAKSHSLVSHHVIICCNCLPCKTLFKRSCLLELDNMVTKQKYHNSFNRIPQYRYCNNTVGMTTGLL